MTTIDTRPRAGSSSLALLHDIDTVLGLRPRQSLVLRVRRRRKPIAVLRLDLPQPPGLRTDATWRLEHLRFAHVLTGLLARVQQAAAVTVVVYGEWAEPERRLVEVVSGCLEAAGFPVEAAVCVAGDRWASVLGAAADRPDWRDVPAPRRQPAVTPGRAGPHRGPFLAIDPIDPERRLRALATLEASFAGADETPGGPDVAEALLDWRGALSDHGGLPADPRAIRLAWVLRHKRIRDGVLLQCAWGFEAAILALHDSPPPADRDDPGGAAPTPGYASFLGDGREPPEAARLRRAVEVLRRVVACAPETLTAPPLAILAWLEWCRGRGSVSAAYLQACLRIDPDYELARLFRPLLASGHVPEWLGR
ncbi:DUF4192 family protein [Herbiconiux sp.]|uniref:DUF4192 family protein n=1 Tax=Herbiconiux sp. TaxID=1871186 RepID=UPI0025C477D7|nr:DUF4192 family protein [Herbiconiux sp.]